LLITPFKLIDRNIKFNDRYFQDLPACPELPDPGYNSTSAFLKIDLAKKAGASIVNIHHDVDIYPFINYPMMDECITDLKELVKKAHNDNLRIGLYYTSRLLTVHQPEFWPFVSLNDEFIVPGGGVELLKGIKPGDPREWFIRNMKGRKFISGNWETMEEGKFKGVSDLSVITGLGSRLNNFYLGGLDWMLQNIGFDDVYLDETTLDRTALRRARKLLDRYRPEGRIDLHPNFYFSKGSGFASAINIYMDILPYLDFTWIGEQLNYDKLHDYWLIEISGIPFGLPGQMLEGGGNPWRGMVYGITKRAGWKTDAPSAIWKFWDEHHIADKIMIGYWEKDCPVRCSSPFIKASIFKGEDEMIIPIANWTDRDVLVSLDMDWAKLGLDPSKINVSIPEIKGFQADQSSVSLDHITIPAKKGFVILAKSIN